MSTCRRARRRRFCRPRTAGSASTAPSSTTASLGPRATGRCVRRRRRRCFCRRGEALTPDALPALAVWRAHQGPVAAPRAARHLALPRARGRKVGARAPAADRDAEGQLGARVPAQGVKGRRRNLPCPPGPPTDNLYGSQDLMYPSSRPGYKPSCRSSVAVIRRDSHFARSQGTSPSRAPVTSNQRPTTSAICEGSDPLPRHADAADVEAARDEGLKAAGRKVEVALGAAHAAVGDRDVDRRAGRVERDADLLAADRVVVGVRAGVATGRARAVEGECQRPVSKLRGPRREVGRGGHTAKSRTGSARRQRCSRRRCWSSRTRRGPVRREGTERSALELRSKGGKEEAEVAEEDAQ